MSEPSAIYAYVWLVFLGLFLIALIPVIIWAVRTRQFSNQDRARYLALRSGIPREEKEETKTEKPPKKEDKE